MIRNVGDTPAVVHVPEYLHFLHDAPQLLLCTGHIHADCIPVDGLDVARDHEHPEFTTAYEMQAPIRVPALRILLEQNVEAAIEGGICRIAFVVALDGGYYAMDLIVLRGFFDTIRKQV